MAVIATAPTAPTKSCDRAEFRHRLGQRSLVLASPRDTNVAPVNTSQTVSLTRSAWPRVNRSPRPYMRALKLILARAYHAIRQVLKSFGSIRGRCDWLQADHRQRVRNAKRSGGMPQWFPLRCANDQAGPRQMDRSNRRGQPLLG